MLRPFLPRLALALLLAASMRPAVANGLQFHGRQASVDAATVQAFLEPRFPRQYAPLGPLLELHLEPPRLQFPDGPRLRLELDLAVQLGQSRMELGTAQLSSALRYDPDHAALMLEQPRLEAFQPHPGTGASGLDAEGRELVNAWLQDYARNEPLYRPDPALLAMLGGMQVVGARIEGGRLVLEFDRDASGLVPPAE